MSMKFWHSAYKRRHSEGTILAVLLTYMLAVGCIGVYLALRAYTDTTLTLYIIGTAIIATFPLPMIEQYMRRPKNRSSY